MQRRGRHRANAERIWALLTDAKGFPRWNSTVTSIEGQIREGERLRVHVPGTDRTFTPTVSGVVPNGRMIWTGGFAPMFNGVRTFQLARRRLDDIAIANRRPRCLMTAIIGDAQREAGG